MEPGKKILRSKAKELNLIIGLIKIEGVCEGEGRRGVGAKRDVSTFTTRITFVLKRKALRASLRAIASHNKN